MVSPMDMLGPRVVSGILRKVDGTLVVVVESKFLLLDPQLSDEVFIEITSLPPSTTAIYSVVVV